MLRKKLLAPVVLAFMLLIPIFITAQSYELSTSLNNGNPGGLNQQGDNTNTGWVSIYEGAATENTWTETQTIPFEFDFYGSTVSELKCSLNGIITFDTSVTDAPANDNVSLPTAELPDNTIACFWDEFAIDGEMISTVHSQTFGTSPNRQFWIRYSSFEYSSYDYAYFSVVLEETSNKVYLVDHNYYGGETGSATVGLQQNATNGVQLDSSPNYVFLGDGGYSDTNNDYYEFFPIGGTLNVATTPSPSDNAIDVSVESELSWIFADGTENYDLLLDTVYPPVALVVDNSEVGVSTYTPTTLSNDVTYYWQIIGRNSTREEVAGRIWSFTTEGAPNELPFADSFEDGFVNWIAEGNVSASQGVPHTGTLSSKFMSQGGLETSSITVRLEEGSDPVLSFWYNIDDQITNEITIDILEAGATEWTTAIWDMDQSSVVDEYLFAEVDLAAYNTEDGAFKLKINGTAYKSGWITNYYIWLDDVQVTVPVEDVPSSYEISTSIDNGNPGGLNQQGDNTNNGWTAIFDGSATENTWTETQTIPFEFDFYGSTVSELKCSLNGIITFDTSVTDAPANDNVSLPTAELPDNTIACFWDEFAIDGEMISTVHSQTFGTSPNRQFWIRYSSFEYSSYDYAYFSVVLEETSNKVYLVDHNYYGGETGSATVGLQQNATNGVQLDSSPNYVFLGDGGYSDTNNDYYEFTPSGSTINLAYNPTPANGVFDVEIDADLFWTFGEGTESYDILLDTNYPPVTMIVDNADATTTEFDPGTLQNYTTYYWQIISRNSSPEEIDGNIWSFTTEQSPHELPFVEYFESDLTDWTVEQDVNGTVSAGPGAPHSGEQCAKYTASGGMITSSISARFEAAENPQLSFWYRVTDNTTNDITVDIKQSGAENWTTAIWDMPFSSPSGEYVFVEVDLTSYNTEDSPFWLKFNGRAFQQGYMIYHWVFIDDIGVGAPANIYPPTELDVDEETGLFTWTSPADNTPSGYNIYLDGELLETVTQTQYQFTDLEYDQTYNASVAAVYDDQTSSIMSYEFTYLLNLMPPSNLAIDEAIGLFTWDAPATRELTGYDIYLDDVFLENITDNEYQFTDLVEDQTYSAGVSAVYDAGTTEVFEIEFTFSPIILNPPTGLSVTSLGYATWNLPIGPQTIQVSPQANDYWTGSTDGTTKTETSMINVIGGDGELGWIKYDISSIPDDAIITDVSFNGYVNDTNWPYWSITPCYDDPVSTEAATLWENIEAVQGQDVCYSFNNESNAFTTGWQTYVLGGTAVEDIQTSINQGWFAVGCVSRDSGNAYFLNLDGWNETNIPYLEVTFESSNDSSQLSSARNTIDFSKNIQTNNTRNLLGYNVYLDDEFVDYTTDQFWQYENLISGQTYIAGITAVFDDGESEISEFEFTFNLTSPENLAVTELGNATWNAPSAQTCENIGMSRKRANDQIQKTSRVNRDLLGYNVYLDNVFVDFTTDLFWQYENLTPEETYTAGVVAVYDEGTSIMVNADFNYQPMLPPTNLTAEIQTFNDVLLNWNLPTDRSVLSFRKENKVSSISRKAQDLIDVASNSNQTRELTGYVIYKDEVEIAEITDTTILTYLDLGVEPGDYEYYITAVYDGVESDPSNSASINFILPVPQNLVAVFVEQEVQISWDAVSNSRDLVEYIVYRNGNEVANGITGTTYNDSELPVGTYTYSVSALYDGNWESELSNDAVVNVTGINEGSIIPIISELIGNYPNPFNPTTMIKFGLHQEQKVMLVIYNIKGEIVRTLVDKEFEAGYHEIFWNGKSNTNETVASGVYFYMLNTGNFSQTKKMIIIK